METQVQITFHGIDASPALSTDVADRVAELERSFGRITSCRVTIEKPHQKGHKGHLYRALIDLELPGGATVNVSRHPGDMSAHEDLKVALRDSFEAARRQLQTRTEKMDPLQTKHHPLKMNGTVMRLFPEEGYGFIETPAGDEVYFHRDSCEGQNWDKVDTLSKVHFTLMNGDKGYYATHVTVTD